MEKGSFDFIAHKHLFQSSDYQACILFCVFAQGNHFTMIIAYKRTIAFHPVRKNALLKKNSQFDFAYLALILSLPSAMEFSFAMKLFFSRFQLKQRILNLHVL